jgi:hypothetical protein
MSMLVATDEGKNAYERVIRCLEAVRESQVNPQLSVADAATLFGFDDELATIHSTLGRLSATPGGDLSQFDSLLDDVHAYCTTVEEGLALLKGATYEHA